MRLVLAAGLSLVTSACTSERERRSDRPTTFWVGEVEAVVTAACASCHGGAEPAGGYDLSSYLGALGDGTDEVANAIAGEASSEILAVFDDSDDSIHAPLAEVRVLLERWVIDARLAYRDSDLHAPGLMNPVDAEFHGVLLASRDWDFAGCARCHGDDFGGGPSEASCLGCHDDGPTACTTCHSDGPTSGAHVAHRQGPLERPAGCADCHVVPDRWDAPGHILRDGVADPAPAEVVFGRAANLDVAPPRRQEPPAYDAATGTCSSVYCHGGILGDPAAAFPEPRWNGGPGQATCGGCHGEPPADHATDRCRSCHPSSIDADGALVTARHLDGVLDVGDNSGGCSACHGDADSAAPPRDLSGEDRPQALGVGAHRSHVLGPHRIANPVACTECHLVPAALAAVGHIDDDEPAEVFPAGSGALARTDGATPTWDRDLAGCAGSYCHGGGDALAIDTAPGRIPTPTWTAVGEGEAACGRCHGLPPQNGVHPPSTIADCTTCHQSVDGFGNILFTGPPGAETTRHLDGIVDLR